MKLSIVVPCYNEKPTVSTLLSRVARAPLTPGVTSKEIIVIDDSSNDGSREILNEINADPQSKIGLHPNDTFKLILLAKNKGKGHALRTGFAVVTGEITLVQDADLEYDPVEYPRLLKPIAENYADVVYGSRFIGSERRVLYFFHYQINWLLTGISNVLTNINLTDMETCFKVFRTDVLRKVKLKSNRFGFEPEITAKMAKLKPKFYEVGVSYHGRTYEEGKKITWKDGIMALWYILRFNLFP